MGSQKQESQRAETPHSEIAQEILNQLGGRKFVIMTGARNLLAREHGLSMHLPTAIHNGKRVRGIEITLDPCDTYSLRVRDWSRAGGKLRLYERGEEHGIYCDQLREAFTRLTGLITELPRIRKGDCNEVRR